jgi:hypothetical protein
MNALRWNSALAAAVFAILGAFGTQASAQSAAVPNPARSPEGKIKGHITFNAVLLFSFNSSACSHFTVVAKVGSGTTVGTSGTMHASLRGKSVECAYSIEGLGAGEYTVVPQGGAGKPLLSNTGQFHGAPKTVTLRISAGIVRRT